MNLIKTHPDDPDPLCTICQETFQTTDTLSLIQHYDDRHPEKINQSRRRQHLFHTQCLNEQMAFNIDREYQTHPDDLTHDPHIDHICPLDRDSICQVIPVKLVNWQHLNIPNYSQKFPQLLPQITPDLLKDINLNWCDQSGKTLLYYACQTQQTSLVQDLINAGANPGLGNDEGFTPLMMVTARNHLDLLAILIQNPQVTDLIGVTDNKGKSAIDYALDNHHFQVLLTLINQINPQSISTLKSILKKVSAEKYRHVVWDFITEIKQQIKAKINQQPQLLHNYPKVTNKITIKLKPKITPK